MRQNVDQLREAHLVLEYTIEMAVECIMLGQLHRNFPLAAGIKLDIEEAFTQHEPAVRAFGRPEATSVSYKRLVARGAVLRARPYVATESCQKRIRTSICFDPRKGRRHTPSANYFSFRMLKDLATKLINHQA